jgi:hypothetical protein
MINTVKIFKRRKNKVRQLGQRLATDTHQQYPPSLVTHELQEKFSESIVAKKESDTRVSPSPDPTIDG